MRTEFLDTAFGNLIKSYAVLCEGLEDEDIEKALRSHARKWGGCMSCRYSIAHPDRKSRGGNIWYQRGCQLGLRQDDCGMHREFPV